MSFLAKNADFSNSQRIQESLAQFQIFRDEYESIINLVIKGEEKLAWKRLSPVLEGELFAQGPTYTYQPAVRELQKSCLLLAFDLAQKEDPEALQNLTIEAIEWFPEESIFWLNLAKSFNNGSMRDLLARKACLGKLLKFHYGDKRLREELVEIDLNIGLITPEKFNELRPVKIPLLKPSEKLNYPTYKLYLETVSKLSQFIEKVCDLFATIEENSNGTGKRAKSSSNTIAPILATHVEVYFLESSDCPGDDTSSSSQPRVKQDESLKLSQPSSIKNLHDFSQVSTRSQSKRGVQVTDENSHLLKSLDSTGLLTILQKTSNLLPHEQLIVDEINFCISSFNERKMSSFGQQLDSPLDRFNPVDNYVITEDCSVKTLLYQTLSIFLNACEKPNHLRWTSDLAIASNKLAHIILTYYDSFSSNLGFRELLWLCEVQHFSSSEVHIEHLFEELGKANCDGITFSESIRYQWLQFHVTQSVHSLDLLSHFLGEKTILAYGAMGNDSHCIIWSQSIAQCREDMEKGANHSIFAEKILSKDELWIKENIQNILAWARESFQDKKFVDLVLPILEIIDSHSQMERRQLFAILMTSAILIHKDSFKLILEASLKEDLVLFEFLSCYTLIEEIIQLGYGSIAFGEFIIRCFQKVNPSALDSEAVFLIIRDLILPLKHVAKDVFKILRFFVSDYFHENSIINQWLCYIILKPFIAAPSLVFPSDHFNVTDALGDFFYKDCDELSSLEAIIAFRAIKALLGDFEEVGVKVFAFLEKLAGVLKAEVVRNTDSLEDSNRHITRIRRQPLALKKYGPNEVSEVLREMLPVIVSIGRKLSSKRKSTENFSQHRDDVMLQVAISSSEQEACGYYWELAMLYEMELHSLMSKDASFLVSESSLIWSLIVGAINCFNMAAADKHTVQEKIDNVKFSRLLSMCKSICYGGLSLFVPDPLKRQFRVGITYFVTRLIEGCQDLENIYKWKISLAKVLLCDIKGVKISTTLSHLLCCISNYINDGRQHFNFDVFYSLATDFITRCFWSERRYRGLFACFREVIGKIDLFTSIPNTLPINEFICQFFEILSKNDKKKFHHEHFYLLATKFELSSLPSFIDIQNSSLGKLCPMLIKKNSSNVPIVSVWQQEYEYPGDYLVHVDRYLYRLSLLISRNATNQEDFDQRVNFFLSLMCKIGESRMLIVRKKRLLLEAKVSMEKLCATYDSYATDDCLEKAAEILESQEVL